jgi:hypothetical protein
MYFSGIYTLIRIPSNLFYLSCPKGECKKKVEQSNQGEWKCFKCNEYFKDPRPRFISKMKFCDDQGDFMITLNGEEACKEIFGKSEKDVYELFTNDFMNYQNFA